MSLQAVDDGRVAYFPLCWSMVLCNRFRCVSIEYIEIEILDGNYVMKNLKWIGMENSRHIHHQYNKTVRALFPCSLLYVAI